MLAGGCGQVSVTTVAGGDTHIDHSLPDEEGDSPCSSRSWILLSTELEVVRKCLKE